MYCCDLRFVDINVDNIKVFCSLSPHTHTQTQSTLTSGSHSSEDVLELFIVHGLGAVEPVQGIAQRSTQFMNKFKLSCVLFIRREEKKKDLLQNFNKSTCTVLAWNLN